MTLKPSMTDRRIRTLHDVEGLSFWENGLLPVVTQDADTAAVLMLAFTNREGLERTLQTGEMHYWSRSRQELWHKGATSGNRQTLLSLHADCDRDSLLARVRPKGPSCHTGEVTCFGDISSHKDSPSEAASEESTPGDGSPLVESTLPELWAVLVARARERPRDSYTVRLLEDENLRLKKLGEEMAELLLALARGEKERVAEEGADLLYHFLTALLGAGVGLEDILTELGERMG